MRKLILLSVAAGICGGIAGVVGFAFGVYAKEKDSEKTGKELELANQEIDYMKKQVSDFRWNLQDIGKDINQDHAVVEANELSELYYKIFDLSEDAFEWFEYKHCALSPNDAEG